MKRYIAVIAALLIIALFALPVAAEESGESEVVVTEEGTEAVVETSSEQTTTDAAEELESAPQIDIGEVSDIINESETITDAIVKVASRFGITIEDAQELVEDIVALGDKYLGETDTWVIIKNDS